ncbi:hypothetical protein ACFQV2_15755 [Actinokineospora soli]|uniref:Uncharacterized protein n=1 Tax=Actinokineospora soli TaxID=1048753 RepID=A0ABW2TPA2_9PSEU
MLRRTLALLATNVVLGAALIAGVTATPPPRRPKRPARWSPP